MVDPLDQSRRIGGGDPVRRVFFSCRRDAVKRTREINFAALGIHGDGIGLPAMPGDERRRDQIQFQQVQWIPSTNRYFIPPL